MKLVSEFALFTSTQLVELSEWYLLRILFNNYIRLEGPHMWLLSHHMHGCILLNKENSSIVNFVTEDQRFGYCRIARAVAGFTTTSL